MAANITRIQEAPKSYKAVLQEEKKNCVCIESESNQASISRAGFVVFLSAVTEDSLLRRVPCLL